MKNNLVEWIEDWNCENYLVLQCSAPTTKIHLENFNKKNENVFEIKGEFKDSRRKPRSENIKGDEKNVYKAFRKLIEAAKDKLDSD